MEIPEHITTNITCALESLSREKGETSRRGDDTGVDLISDNPDVQQLRCVVDGCKKEDGSLEVGDSVKRLLEVWPMENDLYTEPSLH